MTVVHCKPSHRLESRVMLLASCHQSESGFLLVSLFVSFSAEKRKERRITRILKANIQNFFVFVGRTTACVWPSRKQSTLSQRNKGEIFNTGDLLENTVLYCERGTHKSPDTLAILQHTTTEYVWDSPNSVESTNSKIMGLPRVGQMQIEII